MLLNKINPMNCRTIQFFPVIILLITFFCSISLTWAEQKESDSDMAKEIIIKPPIELTKQHKDDLKHYLANDHMKPLLAGPDDYITLVQKYTSANSKGVAILLPEWQQGATNPKAINFLRNALPAQGWSTITIQPNNKPQNFPSLALTIAEQKKENTTTLKGYKDKLSALFNAVMNTATEYPGIVLVMAQGNNGALLVDILSQENSVKPNALILLSSYRQSNYALIDSANEDFARQLAFSEIPTLDLYLKYDNAIILAKALQRKLMARQELKIYYRQRQLHNTVTGYYPEQELLSQINGWLKTIGW